MKNPVAASATFDAGGENLKVVAWNSSATLDKERNRTRLRAHTSAALKHQWMLLNLYPIDRTRTHLGFALLWKTLQCIMGKTHSKLAEAAAFYLHLFVTFL